MMMRRMHFVINHHQRSVKGVVYALLLSLSLSSNSNNAAVVRTTATMTTQTQPQPPVAKKVPHKMELFGDVRVDNYYWLRDDSRSNPDMLSYLKQENAFTDSLMSDSKKFEDELYAEIRGRIKEDDVSAPLRRGAYYYYQRTLEGKEYVQHCRRPVPNPNAPPSVHDTMPTDPNAEEEHIILDENVKAQSYDYYSIGAFKVSPNNKLVAYAEDTKGDEIYTVYVIDAETGATVDKSLVGVTAYLEWASDASLVYITMDDILRPHKAWLHKLGTQQSTDTCLYYEKDDTFSLDLQASESKKFLFVASESKNTRFNFYLDVSNPEDGLKVLTPRVDGIDTSVSHRGNHFFIQRRSDEFFNSELIACPLDNTNATTLLLPHRQSVKIQDIQLFNDHLVVYERENGLPKVTIYGLPDVGESLKSLQGGHLVEFIDPIYSVDPSESQFNSSILRFDYSSMKTPPSVYDYDMKTGVSVLKKIETVLGGFDASNYFIERKWANAPDGTQIPISIVYRKDLVKLDGSDPLLLYGYGSYEICIDPTFKASRLSLLDRGFIYVIAHIRGGGEMGRQWYENGKLLKKKNTFTDFIACAEYLIENKYCSKEKLCVNGRSAGGLLIGAVLNMRPDLFKAAVAGVPFVDVLTTMLDPTIPLTTSEWEEWGDPRKEEFYFYMKSYSPVDNVKAQNYPDILVTAGLNGKDKCLTLFMSVRSWLNTHTREPTKLSDMLSWYNLVKLMFAWMIIVCDTLDGCWSAKLTLMHGYLTAEKHVIILYMMHIFLLIQSEPWCIVTDPRVMYSEPAKFVAKLRDLKTDDNLLLFKCELGAGHFSKSGRFEKLQEDAFTYAFIMKSLNMIPGHGSEQN